MKNQPKIVQVLATIGVTALLAAAVVGFLPMSTSSGSPCGSWIVRDASAAEREDYIDGLAESMLGTAFGSDERERCNDAYSGRTPVVIVLVVLGFGTLAGAAMFRRTTVS